MIEFSVRKSKHGGVGVFANRNFRVGQTITEITGNIIHWRTVLSIGGMIQDNTFRFSNQYFLSPDGIGNYVNHSCEPNAGIVKLDNRLYLKAIGKIIAGQEIVFDYSTIIGDDDTWTMKCQCGSDLCRNYIKNFGSLPTNFKDTYIKLNIVPSYILITLS
jgi:uncharacterized protein